jgi:hypothetical protein
MPVWIRAAAFRLAILLVAAGAILFGWSPGRSSHGAGLPAVHGSDIGTEHGAGHSHGHSHDIDGETGDTGSSHHAADHSHVTPGTISEFHLVQARHRAGWDRPPPVSPVRGADHRHDKPPKMIVRT